MVKYLYNDVLLPEIPADVLAEYPLALLIKWGDSTYHLYIGESKSYVAYDQIAITPGGRVRYDLIDDVWVLNETSNSSVILSQVCILVWSNYDVPCDSADSTEIYFYGSEPVDPNAPEEPTEEVYYKISGERLKGFADQARRLGKFTGELTPEQIEDTLSWIETGLTEEEAQAMVEAAIANLKLQSKTVTPTDAEQTITADEGYFGLASVIVEAAEGGGIPENARLYYVGNAVSVLDMSTLNFESSAVGTLQEA